MGFGRIAGLCGALALLAACSGAPAEGTSRSNPANCLDSETYGFFIANLNSSIENEEAARATGYRSNFVSAEMLTDFRAEMVRGFSPEFADKLLRLSKAWREAGALMTDNVRKEAAMAIPDGRDMPEAGIVLTPEGLCYE